MNARRRVLVVSPVPSHPADQGNAARIQTLASELKSRGCTLDFVYYGMEGLSEKQRVDMERFWAAFHFVQAIPHSRQKFATHWGLDDWCPERLCEVVHALQKERQYDALIVNYVWMSRVLAGINDALRIIDTHDIFGDRHKISTREGLEPRWYFTSEEEENIAFSRADIVIGIQETESAEIRRRTTTETVTVGHLMTPYFLTQGYDARPIATFGYIGSGNPWNTRCVGVLDGRLKAFPQLDWLLAGSISKKKISLQSNPYLLGTVKELPEFYGLVDCVVNPMMGGTGLKIKTVEALAYGKPVIGTRDAFMGFRATHEAHGLVQIEECIEIMQKFKINPSFREELTIASRRLYIEYMVRVKDEIDYLFGQIG